MRLRSSGGRQRSGEESWFWWYLSASRKHSKLSAIRLPDQIPRVWLGGMEKTNSSYSTDPSLGNDLCSSWRIFRWRSLLTRCISRTRAGRRSWRILRLMVAGSRCGDVNKPIAGCQFCGGGLNSLAVGEMGLAGRIGPLPPYSAWGTDQVEAVSWRIRGVVYAHLVSIQHHCPHHGLAHGGKTTKPTTATETPANEENL